MIELAIATKAAAANPWIVIALVALTIFAFGYALGRAHASYHRGWCAGWDEQRARQKRAIDHMVTAGQLDSLSDYLDAFMAANDDYRTEPLDRAN